MYFPVELVTRIWWKIKAVLRHGDLKKVNSWWIKFGPAGSKCLEFMFKDFPCNLHFIWRRPRPHYFTSMNFNTAWELFLTKACGGLRVWLSCFLPKPLDFSMRHGVQNVVPAWGPLMIWVFFFLQQQEDCYSVIKIN